MEALEDRRVLATFTVTSCDDPIELIDPMDPPKGYQYPDPLIGGTLRWAIAEASEVSISPPSPLNHEINFNLPANCDTIELKGINGVFRGQLIYQGNNNVEIVGPGADELTIDASLAGPPEGPDGMGTSDIFEIGGTSVHTTLGISGLTLTGSDQTAPINHVGGDLSLVIEDMVIQGNTGLAAGGVNVNAPIINGDVSLEIYRTTIDGNSGGAGAIAWYGGTLDQENDEPVEVKIVDTTISNNNTAGDRPGALALAEGAAVILLGNVDFDADIYNTTISGNRGSFAAGLSVWLGPAGGATNETRLTNVTITDNQVTETGDKIDAMGEYDASVTFGAGVTFLDDPDVTVTANNTIVAGNFDFLDQEDNIPDADFAVVGGTAFFKTGDPLLTPLRDFGGPTKTHAPLFESPVIDAGDNSKVKSLEDQLGLGRIKDGYDLDGNTTPIVDMGAFEHQRPAFVVDTLRDLDPSAQPGTPLREALSEAAMIGAEGWDIWDHVTFDASLNDSTMLLNDPMFTATARSLEFDSPLHLDTQGTGATDVLTIQNVTGRGLVRIAEVTDSTFVQMDDLFLTRGDADGGNGGAIENTGFLRLRDMVVYDNTAVSGGGVYNTGTLILEDSDIGSKKVGMTELDGNTGGGVYSTGELIVRPRSSDTTVNGNTGDGITLADGTLDAIALTADSNTVNGVALGSAAGSVRLDRSTLSRNDASGLSALFSTSAEVYVVNSTLSSNINAGAFITQTGSVVIDYSTVAGNLFGVYLLQQTISQPILSNSVVIGNSSMDLRTLLGSFDQGESEGNVVGMASANLAANPTGTQIVNYLNQNVADILVLDAMGDLILTDANGGFVETHALAPDTTPNSNVAVGFGFDSAGLWFDGRTFLREPLGNTGPLSRPDSGAYQRDASRFLPPDVTSIQAPFLIPATFAHDDADEAVSVRDSVFADLFLGDVT